MERFANQAAHFLSQVLREKLGPEFQTLQASDLESPPDRNLGDFGFPCFKLSKAFGKSPQLVAQEISEKLTPLVPQEIRVSHAGPYVNFTVPNNIAIATLLQDILKGNDLGTYGSLKAKSRGTWVLEYSSPNVAKPFQIYHLRPTILGAALARAGNFRGFNVISINHLGDWGVQYGMLAVAMQKFGATLPPTPTLKDLVEIYVKINQAAENDPTIREQAKESFLKLERGDAAMTALWQKSVDVSLKEFNALYSQLGIHFDYIWGESYYKDLLTPLLKELKTKGLLIESEGAWVVPVKDSNGKEIPPCILQKSDGATIYATRDVAAARYRYDQFKFDRMTYVVGAEQKLHFQQVFSVLRQCGYPWAEKCEHVPFGLYRFKDAKMSTRKGNFVTLEEVMNLARERVVDLMKARNPEIDARELTDVSRAVATGALVFHDLSTDPIKDVSFELERVVDFEGETGPYLQYAHTRCLSILRKARESGELKSLQPEFSQALVSQLKASQEIELVKFLGQFPLHLERTLRFSKASQLATYLIDITKLFGNFYRECKVLGEAPELTGARLMLVEATRRILAQGLGILGVPLPEKM